MDGNLEILNTSNSGTPAAVGRDVKPLLCLDMWEHSFMPDYGYNKQVIHSVTFRYSSCLTIPAGLCQEFLC